MAQFKIIKPVDFGPYTITGPSGNQLDKVPLNNYAPKVGQIIEGALETKHVPDGNGNFPVKTGITWPIRTNGSASTQAQTSIQFISQDHFEPDSSIVVNDTPPSNPNNPIIETASEVKSTCWICDNAIYVIIGIIALILIGVFIYSQD